MQGKETGASEGEGKHTGGVGEATGNGRHCVPSLPHFPLVFVGTERNHALLPGY